MTISRILVPTDFSADGDAAVRYALDLARMCHAQVHLLHVVDDPLAAGMWSSEVYTYQIAELQINLVREAEVRLAQAIPSGAANVSSEVRTGSPWRKIIEVAAERSSDLIVMGTHGRTGVAHIVMGSVAERVLRRAPCPVLTLRAVALPADAAIAHEIGSETERATVRN
jgi:universal stress protein A